MLPPSEEVKWVARTCLCQISRVEEKMKTIATRKGCLKCSALSLLLPSLHLQSTIQNALLQMGYTPHPHLPMTYL